MLDSGEPPDLSKICAREVGGDQPGGLGTNIIREIMDSVSYQRTESGNRFLASKRLRK
jgi:anti-sigma regulatory factor (Ser/Thr protein kinase)